MQYRHPLETALSQAIKEDKEKQALKLIDIFLLENTGANLASLDLSNESFLFQALNAGLEELATQLLAIQKDDQSILFGKNINQQTLFQIVAKQGYVDILKNLISNCESLPSFTNFWLEKDNKGDTVLHIAARADKTKVIELLLDHVKKDTNSKNIVNQTNLAGKTALHEAFCFYSNETIKLLIENDADVNVRDNDNTSPFDLICKREFGTQLQLIRSLTKEKQNAILQCYRQKIISNPNKKEIKKMYFTLLGLNSLQALVLGLHEFDENIPIRNSFFNAKENLEMNVPLEILNRMPIYFAKLKNIAQEMKIQLEQEEENPDEKIMVLEEENKNTLNYQLINENRLKLNNLIVEIENYLQLLEGRKQVPFTNKALARFFPILFVLIYVTVEAFLIYEAVISARKLTICQKNNKDNDYKLICAGEDNTDSAYFLSALFFGIFGATAAIFGGAALYFHLIEKPPNISSREKNEFLNAVQAIVENLKEMEKDGEALFTSHHNITALENILKIFNSKSYLPITTIITEYTNIKKTLNKIRKDLNGSQKPISLFFQPRDTVLTINEVPEPFNEKTPLLKGSSIHITHLKK